MSKRIKVGTIEQKYLNPCRDELELKYPHPTSIPEASLNIQMPSYDNGTPRIVITKPQKKLKDNNNKKWNFQVLMNY